MRFALVLALTVALPAAAQEVPFDPAVLDDCEDGPACVAQGAWACQDAVQGGLTDRMEAACFHAEAEYWRARGDKAASGVANWYTGNPAARESLAALHPIWESYLAARCAFARADAFGDGNGGGLVEAICRMRLAAERAFYFEGLATR